MAAFECLACGRDLRTEARPFSIPVSDTVSANPLCRPCATPLGPDEMLSYLLRLLETWPPETRPKEGTPGRIEAATRALEAWRASSVGDENPLDVWQRLRPKAKAKA